MELYKDLKEELQEAIKRGGLKEPTELQKESFSDIYNGDNVVLKGKNGEGKTYAYLLPVLNKILTQKINKIVILAPSEKQIKKIERQFLRVNDPIKIKYSIDEISDQSQINIINILSYKQIINKYNLINTDILIIDPVDVIVDQGYEGELEKIMDRIKVKDQSIFVVSEISFQVQRILRKYMKDWIFTGMKNDAFALIRHYYYMVNKKYENLIEILKIEDIIRGIIYCSSKEESLRITNLLKANNFKSTVWDDELSFEKIIKEDYKYITVSDEKYKKIAEEVTFSHVLLMDICDNIKTYLNRIAGRKEPLFNNVINIVSHQDIGNLYLLKSGEKINFEEKILPDLDEIKLKNQADKIELLVNISAKEDIPAQYLDLAKNIYEFIDGEKIIAYLLYHYLSKNEESIDFLADKLNNLKLILKQEESKLKKNSFDSLFSNNKKNCEDDFELKQEKSVESEEPVEERHGNKWLFKKQSEWKKNDSSILSIHEKGELYINVGKRDGVTTREIIKFITGKASIDEMKIGKIRIMDRATYVELNAYILVEVASVLNGARLGGKIVTVEPVKKLMI